MSTLGRSIRLLYSRTIGVPIFNICILFKDRGESEVWKTKKKKRKKKKKKKKKKEKKKKKTLFFLFFFISFLISICLSSQPAGYIRIDRSISNTWEADLNAGGEYGGEHGRHVFLAFRYYPQTR